MSDPIETPTPKLRLRDDQLNDAVRAAYNLSQPQGLGYLHFDPEPMTAVMAQKIIDAPHNQRMLGMDYVSGRAVKLTIHKDEDGWYIYDHGRWYDHSDETWQEFKTCLGFD